MPLLIPFIMLVRFLRAIWRALQEPEFRSLFIWVVVILLGGMLFYHRVEGWGWLDALYFTVITLTTVGYGDLTPAQPVAKLFTIFYIFLGLGILLAFVEMIAARHRTREERPLSQLADKTIRRRRNKGQ